MTKPLSRAEFIVFRDDVVSGHSCWRAHTQTSFFILCLFLSLPVFIIWLCVLVTVQLYNIILFKAATWGDCQYPYAFIHYSSGSPSGSPLRQKLKL